jgi:sugar/nucleoside kinase (ribokinase family)
MMNLESPLAVSRTLCVGILVADIIGRPIDAVPARGALQLVPSITPHIGGCAANTGIGLQILGVETRVVGKVGRDGFGAFVQGELQRHGVTSHIIEDNITPTSSTMVLVSSDAERTFLHCTGANATFTFADFNTDWLSEAELLHIAGHGLMPGFDGAPCADLLRQARERGLKTSLDTAGVPDAKWRENLEKCLPYLDYFVPACTKSPGCFRSGSARTHRGAAAKCGRGRRRVENGRARLVR